MSVYINGFGSEAATISDTHRGEQLQTLTDYNLAGQPVKVTTELLDNAGQPTLMLDCESTYDRHGRPATGQLIYKDHVFNLGRTAYDRLGHIASTTYEGDITRTFTYDLHGWLTEWTCKDLTQRLSYANGTNPSYTGRISAKSTQGGGSLISTYNYSYDQLGRLISADYKQSSVTNPGAFTLADYSTAYSYDLQGNILTLERKGPERSNYYGIIDDIKATYQGNQIATLRDDAPSVLLETSLDLPNGSWSGNDFGYDANGNQTRDLSRGVADIAYNTLNLPEHVEMNGVGSIGYLYTADGTKLAEIVRDEDDRIINRRDYVGAFEYEADSIVRFSPASGYLTVADTVYHLYTPDYQGNIVAVYNTRRGSREHYKDYYPYGLPHAPMPESSSITHVFPSFPGLNPGLNPGLGPIIKPTDPEPEPSSTNRRWYGSKELTTDHGLNTYDFAARQLAPAFPRFTTVDPMATDYHPISPYTYCGRDPINFSDPTGQYLVFIDNDRNFMMTYLCAWFILRGVGASKNLDFIANSDVQVNITSKPLAKSVRDSRTAFNPATMTIHWDPQMAIFTNLGYLLSPVENLQHEADHAVQAITNPEQMMDDAKPDDSNPYSNKEEQRVIEGSERETAIKLKRINEDEATRTDHNGIMWDVKRIDATEDDIDGIIVTPK